MNNISFNNSNAIKSHIDYNNSSLKSKPLSIYNSPSDSVSFSGSTPKTSGGFMGILSKLGLHKAEQPQVDTQQKVHQIWLEGDGVTESDANSELANSLRAMTYPAEHRDYGSYKERMYSEPAIKTIVKYQKQNPELAEKLTELFKHSERYDKVSDLEYLAQKQQTAPETIEKYKSGCFYPRSFVSVLKASDINETLTDSLFNQKRADGTPRFGTTYDILALVEADQQIGNSLISKYATDPRVDLTVDDITALCEKDEEHATQIEELIQFAYDNKLTTNLRTGYASKILTPYLQDATTTKALMKLGVFDSNNLEGYTESYTKAPKQLETILRKKQETQFMPIQRSEIGTYALKLQQYEQGIETMTGVTPEDLTINQIKSLIDLIDKTKKEANRLVKHY